jgi:hypothetical protein
MLGMTIFVNSHSLALHTLLRSDGRWCWISARVAEAVIQKIFKHQNKRISQLIFHLGRSKTELRNDQCFFHSRTCGAISKYVQSNTALLSFAAPSLKSLSPELGIGL